MGQQSDSAGPLDPFGAFRTIRDAGMDAWSKMMIEAVNTEQFAQGMGAWLDSYLTISAPLRKAVSSTMTDVLSALNMPTRDDVIGLSERLTNIEMRLDDLDAKLDSTARAPRPGATRASAKKDL
jgi:hypothetical protein